MFSKFFFVTLVVSSLLFSSLLADRDAALKVFRDLRKNQQFQLNPGADAVMEGIIKGEYRSQDDIKRALGRQKITLTSLKSFTNYPDEDNVLPFNDPSISDPKYDVVGYAEAPNADGDVIVGVLLVQTLGGKIDLQALIKAITDWRKKSGKTKSCTLVSKLSQFICKFVSNKNYNIKTDLDSYYKRSIPLRRFIAQGVRSVDDVMKAWQDGAAIQNMLLDDSSNLELGFCAPDNTGEVHAILVNN